MIDRAPQEELNAVISEQDARRFYLDGCRRWRKPHRGRHIAPSGLDTDSMDFRGVKAAFAATATLPKEYDAEGKRLPIDPQAAKVHFELGLTAVQRAGLVPLDDRFVEGYQRWADAVVQDEARQSQETQSTALTEPSTV